MRAKALCLCLLSLPAAAADAPAAAVLPEGEALTRVIRERDEALFSITFETCDLDALRPMLADDLEFYHDKGGVTARSADEFVAVIARNCAGWREPQAWRSRRELVAATLRVDPIPGYGAMEVGEHRFHERQGDGPERLAGAAGFAMVWKLEDGQWKLSRVLSYGHHAP